MYRQTKEGVIISLHVLPNAPKSQIVGEHNGSLKIKIKAPPVDGKTNEAIVKFFSDVLGISKSKIEILKGDKSKEKSLQVKDLSLEQIQAKVESLLKAKKPPEKK